MGILLVYDITDEQSFINIRNWMRQIEQHASENVNKILIGNKCDKEQDRTVSTSSAKAWCEEQGSPCTFFECSAKNATNVEQASRRSSWCRIWTSRMWGHSGERSTVGRTRR